MSIIPAGAIFDRSLEPRDLHMLALLGSHTDKAGWCRRSQVRMAKQLNCGRASIQRSLERLCEAGWVEKKRPPWMSEAGQPSASYMYRVVLDRDDDVSAADDSDDEAAESHAETASEEGGCPPVGTPAQPDGHPGAQPCVGTGAHTCVGTKNDPLERPLIEREREARARDRNARFLTAFEARWPTAAADDRQRTAYAAEALSEAEQEAALAGIGPFMAYLERLKRKGVPAGWRYLEEKRWTLLETADAKAALAPERYERDSVEAKAIEALHELANCTELFRKAYCKDGAVFYRKHPVTPQLAALAALPPAEAWVILDRSGAGAWEGLLRNYFPDGVIRRRFREGMRAPWPFPPSATGKIYTASGPPQAAMSEQDAADFT
ncbi:helix-turn-helix domain-containing protein [Bradyrhizobium sp. HKCCYLRH3099]|uniref:helix-turn-helix domain-containing protein n=1 Tax=unclassified Bradyrhizobium TaxID=2631580 RepID=UPI003EBC5306